MNTKKLLVFILLLMAIYCTELTSSETSAVTLQVRSKVVVDDKFVTIGDIADVQTKDKDLKEYLMAVKLCEAPLLRQTFTWDRPYLRSILHQVLSTIGKTKEKISDADKKIKEITLDSLSIEGDKVIQISTKYKAISSEEIIRQVEEFINNNPQKNVVVEVLSKPRTVKVPPGEIKLKVLAPNEMKIGFITLSVQISVDKKPYTTIPILLKVVNSSGSHPKENGAKNVFNRAVNNSKSDPLVKHGDLVVLTLKIKSIEITTLAKALQRGAKGDLIRVMNVDSKKIVAAEVIDKNRVKGLINLGIK